MICSKSMMYWMPTDSRYSDRRFYAYIFLKVDDAQNLRSGVILPYVLCIKEKIRIYSYELSPDRRPTLLVL